jgi:hypothetical protein
MVLIFSVEEKLKWMFKLYDKVNVNHTNIIFNMRADFLKEKKLLSKSYNHRMGTARLIQRRWKIFLPNSARNHMPVVYSMCEN